MANARVGRQNKITRRWAKRGTRPSAPHDQRTISSCIFGAICPALGKGAGLVLPVCNTGAMTLHLAEIARAVAPGAHAVVLMDQAGWHMTGARVIPDTISVLPLPAKCPELNPVENIRQFMRENWLSNRIFLACDDVLDHCCEGWNKLIDQPDRIASTGCRAWANEVRSVQVGIKLQPVALDLAADLGQQIIVNAALDQGIAKPATHSSGI